MRIEITGGTLVDPANSIESQHNLYIDESFVIAIDNKPDGYLADKSIDATGKIVTPGLVDLRARLREPGAEHKSTIESETLAAVAGGITTLCCPPDTDPPIDTPAMAQMIQQRAWQVGRSFIHPLGALTRNLEGVQLTDMAALEEAGCVGVSNALEPVQNTLIMRRAMQYASTFDLTVFLYSQDPWLQGNGVVHEGSVSTRLGLPAIPEAAETVGVARDLALVEQTGVRAHFCQLSSARAIEMVAESQQNGYPVSADVTAHHLHLSENDIGEFDTNCHVLPPLRSLEDRDRLRQAVAEGVVSCICSDHQPHEPDAKLAPFSESEPGISSLESLLPLALRLVDDGSLKLSQAIAALTQNPAQLIGSDLGQLGVGSSADICILNPEMEWTFSKESMVSKGHNSPFLDWTFKGRVVETLIGGESVFQLEG